jgi:hypothetical protein
MMGTSGVQRFNGCMHMRCRPGLAADGLEKAAVRYAVKGPIPSLLMDGAVVSYLVPRLIGIPWTQDCNERFVRI